MMKKRWLYSVIGVFSALVVFWITATLFLSPAYANAIPFSMKVRSSLIADYNPEDGKSLFTALRLSILGDSFLDQGLSPEEAEKRRLALESSLDDPVPTATALDFDGNAPPTATPTKTALPSITPTTSATPTRTPVPTRNIARTGTAKPATVAPSDVVNPAIPNAGTITPTPGPLTTCSRTIYVSNVTVTDSAPSSGIKWVKLKYKVYDNAEATIYAGYIYSSPFTLCSGGFTPGGGWDACYDGPPSGFNIQIYPGFSTLGDYTGPGPFKVKLWLIADDNAGNSTAHFYGDYTMPNTCDDPPPSTDTPVPTDTTAPNILTFDVSPTPGSVLSTCTINLNDMQIYDPAFSMGISASGVYFGNERPTVGGGDYLQPAPGVSGILGPGNDWSGGASGTVTLSGLAPNDTFDVYGAVTDIAGNGPVYTSHITYTMDSVTTCP